MRKVSTPQIERYPIYLKCLLDMRESGVKTVSAPILSRELSFSEEQVRKDLQAVTRSNGKPKSGRDINELIEDIKLFLNYNSLTRAAVVGVGHLGKALMNYNGFNDFGLEIVCGFDNDSKLIGNKENGKDIYSIYQIGSKVEELGLEIVILATPSDVAQDMSERFINAGIKGIWNFVPTHLKVKPGISVENVNLASSFALLQHKLRNEVN